MGWRVLLPTPSCRMFGGLWWDGECCSQRPAAECLEVCDGMESVAPNAQLQNVWRFVMGWRVLLPTPSCRMFGGLWWDGECCSQRPAAECLEVCDGMESVALNAQLQNVWRFVMGWRVLLSTPSCRMFGGLWWDGECCSQRPAAECLEVCDGMESVAPNAQLQNVWRFVMGWRVLLSTPSCRMFGGL